MWDEMPAIQQVSYIKGYSDGLAFHCFEAGKKIEECTKKYSIKSAELMQKVMTLTGAIYSSPSTWHIPLQASMRFIIAFARGEISPKAMDDILTTLGKQYKKP